MAPHTPDIVKAGGIADSSGEAGAPETRELRPTKLATLDGVREHTEGSAVELWLNDKFSDKEAKARFEAALKSALSTPHKPLKEKPKVKKAAKKAKNVRKS